MADIKKANASILYFFVYINGEDVRAELSRPKSIEGKQFDGFHERIYIIKAGEWAEVMPRRDSEELETQDFEIAVTRKE